MVYANASHAVAAHAAPRHRLDGTRITAGAGAIAANAAILLLMLAPVAIPELRPQLIRMPDVVWIPRERTTPPPIQVPVRPVQAQVRPTPAARPTPVDPPPTQSRPMEGDANVPPQAETGTTDNLSPGGDGEIGGQDEVLTGTVLQYASAPPPGYPREALRNGLTGIVVLEVLVGVDGRPLQAEVVTSSGHRVLDLAARRQVLARWMFKPAVQAGVPVQAIGRVPVEFRLDR
ncbi:energy transducer TonB [Aerolutibacter daejeonensis]|uniref:energy transducer TonB n=1 Tax=Aerolutibacter daejeonensis TaxID=346181 RepID=UPI0006925F3E|nr:energy transducer TonB [Lysobacter daejeonensis]